MSGSPGAWSFKMVSDLFVDLAFEDLRYAGQDGYGSVTVWVQGVSPFEEGDDHGSFPILGDLRRYERLNRLVIGVATMAADSFSNRGSKLSSPADLYGSRFCSSF